MEYPLENFMLASATHGAWTHTIIIIKEKRDKQANKPRMEYYLRYIYIFNNASLFLIEIIKARAIYYKQISHPPP